VYGLRTVSLRLTNTYGPRMDLRSDTKGFLGVFIRKALLGERVDLFGDGRQKRDFNYVDDVVRALLLAGLFESVNGRSYNLGFPRPYSLREVVDLLRTMTAFDCRCVPFPAEHEAIDIGDYYADSSAYQAATGWKPETDLPIGLQRTLDFFRQHWDRYLPARS
jgi:nucleoside-diphosphate-sugar epimerase